MQSNLIYFFFFLYLSHHLQEANALVEQMKLSKNLDTTKKLIGEWTESFLLHHHLLLEKNQILYNNNWLFFSS